MTWNSVGPQHISGAIRQVVIDPQNRRRLYAVSANGGIWRLDNVDNYPDGTTWQPLTDDLNNLRFRTMALAPSASQVIYAANSVKQLLTGPISCSSHIYVSANRGDSWGQIQNPTVDPGIGVVHRLAVHPANHRIVFAATSTGLWRRNRLGVWSNLFSDDCMDVVLDPDDSSIIYLGVRRRGVFKSFTAGADWSINPIIEYDTTTPPGTSTDGRESIKIALGKRNSDQTLQTATTRTVAVRLGPDFCVSHTSGEGGPNHWSRVRLSDSQGGNENRSDTDPIRFHEWCNCVAVDPFNPNNMATGGNELLHSTDGGGTWEVSENHPHEDEHSIAFDNEIRGLVYLANDGGLFASLDGGGTWPTMKDIIRNPDQSFNLARGLVTTEFRHSAVRGGCCLAAIDHSGLIICNDLGTSNAVWQFGSDFHDSDLRGTSLSIASHKWERHMVFACPASVNRYYVVRLGGGDRGKVQQLDISWTNGRASSSDLVSLSDLEVSFPPVSTYLPEHQIYLNYEAGPFAVRFSESDDERLILFATNHLTSSGRTIQSLRLSANGTTVRDNEAEAVNLPGRVHAITFAPNNPDRAFAITRVGELLERNFSTTELFQLVSPLTLPPNDRFVFRLVATHGPSLSLFALSQLAVTRFDDDTRTWASQLVWNEPNEFLLSLVADPSNSDRLFLGTTRGVYRSENRGLSFEAYQAGLPHVPITELTFDQGYLYAATLGRGLWRFGS